jgi:hypothetical protein
VARAILLDPEARNDTAGPNDGRLKDPIYHAVSFVRALNGSVGSAPDGQGWTFSRMAMEPLAPATVFSFYSPLYHIPKSPLFGPEFQIYTPTEAVLRGNFFYSIMNQATSDFLIDMTPFRNAAGNTTQLIDLIDQTLMYGRMPQPMRQSLANAIIPQYDNTSKALTGLYLAVLSGLYAVQY